MTSFESLTFFLHSRNLFFLILKYIFLSFMPNSIIDFEVTESINLYRLIYFLLKFSISIFIYFFFFHIFRFYSFFFFFFLQSEYFPRWQDIFSLVKFIYFTLIQFLFPLFLRTQNVLFSSPPTISDKFIYFFLLDSYRSHLRRRKSIFCGFFFGFPGIIFCLKKCQRYFTVGFIY